MAHLPTFELSSSAGRALVLLVDRLKDAEDDNGGWNGGDVVQLLTRWMEDHGLDPRAPAGSLGSRPPVPCEQCPADIWPAPGDRSDVVVSARPARSGRSSDHGSRRPTDTAGQLLTVGGAGGACAVGNAAGTGGRGRYAMESWSPVTPLQPGRDRETRSSDWRWVRMDRGPARKVWLPRASAIDAGMKCMRWTGLLCIPEMQVLDLDTGDVVWRDRWSGDDDPFPGPRVLPEWVGTAEQRVRAIMRAEAARLHAAELADARRWLRMYGSVADHVLLRLPELAAEIAGSGAAAAAEVVEPVQESLW